MSNPALVTARVRAGLRAILGEGRSVTSSSAASLRGLDREERRAVKDALFGIAVWRRALAPEAIDDVGATPPAAVDDAVALLLARWQTTSPSQLMEALRGAEVVDAAGLAVVASVGDAVASALVRGLGLVGAQRFLVRSNIPGPVTLRVNTLAGDRQRLCDWLAAEGIDVVAASESDLPWAVEVRAPAAGTANLSGSAAFRAGAFEVQDRSSQRAIHACAVRPGDVVVDLCAGRGGKTLGLAAAMADQGQLWVHDVDARSLADLRGRVRRLGLRAVKEGLPSARQADVVLVDAPCSSIGVLRRSPDRRFARLAELEDLGDVQRALLAQAFSLVRPGGRVVYATCSVLPVENEAIAGTAPTPPTWQRTLGCPSGDDDGSDVGGDRDDPDDRGDGFFIAVWEDAP